MQEVPQTFPHTRDTSSSVYGWKKKKKEQEEVEEEELREAVVVGLAKMAHGCWLEAGYHKWGRFSDPNSEK